MSKMKNMVPIRVKVVSESFNGLLLDGGIYLAATHIHNAEVACSGGWMGLQDHEKDGMCVLYVPEWVAMQRGLL